MTLFGETNGLFGATCIGCNSPLELRVLRSFAGYYVGYMCDNCGPYSRESGYYHTHEEAEVELLKAKLNGTIDNTR